MIELFQYSGVFLVGVIAAMLGATVGGGGLLSIPFLIFVGLPPHIAIATNRFGSVGASIGALVKFSGEKKIIWEYVLPFTLIAVIGGYLGARILLVVDDEALSRVVGFILLAVLPVIFIHKDMGVRRERATALKKYIGYCLDFLISVWGGFFTAGGGILNRYVWMHFFGLRIVEISATNKIPWLASSIVVLLTFMYAGVVHYAYGLTLFFGMLAGGYLGAHWAVKKGDLWVKRAFAVFVVISTIQLIFFS